jgi:hypothetical protein
MLFSGSERLVFMLSSMTRRDFPDDAAKAGIAARWKLDLIPFPKAAMPAHQERKSKFSIASGSSSMAMSRSKLGQF